MRLTATTLHPVTSLRPSFMAIAPPVDSSLRSIRCEAPLSSSTASRSSGSSSLPATWCGADSAVPTGSGEMDRVGDVVPQPSLLTTALARRAATRTLLEPAGSLGPRDGARFLEALAHLCGHGGSPSPAAWRTPGEQLAAQPPELGVEHGFAALARVGQSRLDGGKPLVDPVELQAAFGQQRELRRVPETQAREPERLESLAHLGKAAVAIALRRDRPSANDERAASPAREAIFVGEIDRPSRQLLSCSPVFLEEEDPGGERRRLGDRERPAVLLGKGHGLGLDRARSLRISSQPPPQTLEGARRHYGVDPVGPIRLLECGRRRQRLGQERLGGGEIAAPEGGRPSQEVTLQSGGGAQA